MEKYEKGLEDNERDKVLESVRENGFRLRDMPDWYKGDREVVLEAIRYDGKTLEYASDELKDAPEIVVEAIRNNGWCMKHASERLKKSREFARRAIKVNANSLNCFSDEIRLDDEYVIMAFENGLYKDVDDWSLKNEMVPTESRKVREALLKQSARSNQERCLEMAQRYGVEYFVHFTTVETLKLILKSGLRTRRELEEGGLSELIYFPDSIRLDRQLDTISLSVTKPNRQLFAIKRKYQKEWCIIRLKADEILKHKCYFMGNNAANHAYDKAEVKREERDTVYDFLSLLQYDPVAGRLTNNPVKQAEVMCTEDIPLSEFNGVIFENEKTAEEFKDTLADNNIECIVDMSLFP